jgi:hypothetical protein
MASPLTKCKEEEEEEEEEERKKERKKCLGCDSCD